MNILNVVILLKPKTFNHEEARRKTFVLLRVLRGLYG